MRAVISHGTTLLFLFICCFEDVHSNYCCVSCRVFRTRVGPIVAWRPGQFAQASRGDVQLYAVP